MSWKAKQKQRWAQTKFLIDFDVHACPCRRLLLAHFIYCKCVTFFSSIIHSSFSITYFNSCKKNSFLKSYHNKRVFLSFHFVQPNECNISNFTICYFFIHRKIHSPMMVKRWYRRAHFRFQRNKKKMNWIAYSKKNYNTVPKTVRWQT